MRRSVRRRGDGGGEAIERRPCPVARRNRDDDRLGPAKRLFKSRVRLGAVELIGLNALATQRAHGFGRPRRSARLDPGLAMNEAPGAIAEPEEEDPHLPAPRPLWRYFFFGM